MIGPSSWPGRSMIGARATLHAAGRRRRQMQEVRSGSTLLPQSDLRLHFGLGFADKIDKVEIEWPYGKSNETVMVSRRINSCQSPNGEASPVAGNIMRGGWVAISVALLATGLSAQSPANPRSGYVGSQTCGGCHANISKKQELSNHALSLRAPGDIGEIYGSLPFQFQDRSSRAILTFRKNARN